MKKMHIWSFGLIIFIIGCEDKNVNDEIDESLKEFISVDIKQNGPEFFTFSENKGTTTEPSSWDLQFAIVDYQPSPMAPAIKDPVIIINSEKTAARIDAASIKDVGTIPAPSEFKAENDKTYLTQGWYNYNQTTHQMSPKDFVFAVNIDDTKYRIDRYIPWWVPCQVELDFDVKHRLFRITKISTELN